MNHLDCLSTSATTSSNSAVGGGGASKFQTPLFSGVLQSSLQPSAPVVSVGDQVKQLCILTASSEVLFFWATGISDVPAEVLLLDHH